MLMDALQTGRLALRDASLIAGARLDCLMRTCAQGLSRRSVIGVGLLAAAVAAIAYLGGADVRVGADIRAGFAGSQLGLLPMVTSVTQDDRT
jgi:hypothetical protein